MASRDYLKHIVSPSEPNSVNLGDEWFRPDTNTLFKRVAENGTNVKYKECVIANTDGSIVRTSNIAAPNFIATDSITARSATILNGLKVSNLSNPASPNNAITINSDDTVTFRSPIRPSVVAASATSGSLTIQSNITDLYKAEGLTGAITFLQPSGTPADGQKLMIRIEDNGTIRGITWTITAGAFRAVGITLPTTTVASKVTYVGCVYNATDVFWDAVATVTQA